MMPYNPKLKLPGAGGKQRRRRQPIPETPRAELDYSPTDWEYSPESSRVQRARYDSKNMIMEVDWQDGGLSYIYFGVPPNVWRNFKRSVSKGKFVARVLDKYEYAPKVD